MSVIDASRQVTLDLKLIGKYYITKHLYTQHATGFFLCRFKIAMKGTRLPTLHMLWSVWHISTNFSFAEDICCYYFVLVDGVISSKVSVLELLQYVFFWACLCSRISIKVAYLARLASSEAEGLLGLDILVVSFLPFGECGQCNFHALPHV